MAGVHTSLSRANGAYSEEQVDRYQDYISLPPQYRRRTNPARNLEFLTALYIHQISAIPYENLGLHYSKDHCINLKPQILYDKFTRNGRGGYCMENGIFFNHILRSLGFRVYLAGARVRPRLNGVPHGDYMGWYETPLISTIPVE